MNIAIKINTDNAAFDPEPNQELARLLHATANKVYYGEFELAPGQKVDLRDSNGNVVGQLKVTK